MRKILHLIPLSLLCIGTHAQSPFSSELKPGSGNLAIKLDCRIFGGDYAGNKDFVDVLAISQDCTAYDRTTKKFSPIKGNISSVYLVQNGAFAGKKIDSSATVFATLDKNIKNAVTGDGGGVISFNIKREANKEWKVVSTQTVNGRKVFFRNVSFKTAGGTVNNKTFSFLGTVDKSTQRFLVTEGANINTNKDLVGFSDTADYKFPDIYTTATEDRSVIPSGKTIKKYQNMGWVSEIDAKTDSVIGKVHRMGRGVTSVTISLDVSKFYIVYGGNPSILLKYEPFQTVDVTNKLDFPTEDPNTQGDGSIYLKAYKQNADGTGGFTVPVAVKQDSIPDPNNSTGPKILRYAQIFDSLLIAKDVAIRAGATLFANIGDIAVTTDDVNGEVILLSEKGIDDSGTANNYTKYKNQLAAHLKVRDADDGTADGRFSDPFGRVLAISSNDNLLRVSTLTEGGASRTGNYFFSNPDKFEIISPDVAGAGTTLIIVKENIPATSMGRNPSGVAFNQRINEAYFVELGSSLGVLPNDNSDALNLKIAPLPFDQYQLYQSGSMGSDLSSSGGYMSPVSGTFITNGQKSNNQDYDTYLTVVNGYNGTDKSMILAVRNIYPNTTDACVPVVITSYNENKILENTLNVWPNPAKDVLHVNETANYTLNDMSGLKLRTYRNTNSLDLNGLSKGIYLIQKETGEVRKIVVE